jgi:gamma-glutamyl-gamma-aminobutyrate hydrolase PuuD
MKKIGITQRTSTEMRYPEVRDSLDQRWILFFERLGMLPINIPNSLNTAKELIKNIALDGFLLTGGNSSISRSQVEHFLIDHSIANLLPLIGVCHGMQTIQEYFGIPLEKVSGHVQEEQKIQIYDSEQIVNSYHEYGATKTCEELEIWACHIPDGVIKGIQHAKLPILGLMWHPERFNPFRDEEINLFTNFFQRGS